ncbi:cell division protein FtsZ [Bacteroidales bacterium]|nr:cell division protein FtsZ [Bacteroidales bacterium]
MDDKIFDFVDYPTANLNIIKVIGVGGGGGNAVSHMFREGIHEVSFVLCNTDNQALLASSVPNKLQLGKTITKGLGAGNKPEKAKLAAEESADDLRKLLDDGTQMVFITAGMGGGTGTGAAPVIAKIAKDMGILTVGIVTIPFVFEGERKILQALYGVEEISKNVDALLVINNERLLEVYQDFTVLNAFAKADNTLAIAAKSIAEIITVPGHVNLDFADVHTILKDGGVAIMSSGVAKGEKRVFRALESALNSPLLNNNDIFNAKKILLNVSFGEKCPLMMEEMNDVNDFMAKFGKGVKDVIWGTAVENSLEENIKVTLLATGFGISNIPLMADKISKDKEKMSYDELIKMAEDEEKSLEDAKLIGKYYPMETLSKIGKTTRPRPFIFSLDQLDDDNIIDLIIQHPAYNRDPKLINNSKKKTVPNQGKDDFSKNKEVHDFKEKNYKTIKF